VVRDFGATFEQPSFDEQCKNSGRGRGLLGRAGRRGGESAYAKIRDSVHDGAGFLFWDDGKDCGIEAIITKMGGE